MRGKRRFIVALTVAGLIAMVEMIGQIWGTGGWTVNGQVALLGLAGFYFAGDAVTKVSESKNGSTENET